MIKTTTKMVLLSIGTTISFTSLFSQTSGYSGTGANIDVVYHRANWRINPDSSIKAIGGSVTTYFVTMQANVNAITFDLNTTSFPLANVNASYHGSSIAVSRPASTTNIIKLTLPVSLPLNRLDSVTINYNGTPPSVTGQAEGYQKKTSTGSNNYIYTLSESFEDRDWWPCKADMQDKIDSMDFFISVPNGFRAATNGVLVDSSLSGSSRIFQWKTRYPMASYLVAVGVAKYFIYDRGTVNIGGTNVPVWYFVFPGKTSTAYTNILNALDFSKQELTAFSSKYGDYPFKNEKHGFYEFGWNGGMEHQTFSAMSGGAMTSWGTIAHELMHQWFGDKVTFGTWNHLWLAEGFARYGEILAAELVPGLGQNPVTLRGGASGLKANALALSTTSIFIPNVNIANSDALWSSNYGSSVYERGAMVVSMLRTLVGDAKFFEACQNYLNDPVLAYRSATTEDLKNHFEAVTGWDLDPFFNDWVYGTGNPIYNSANKINWGYNTTLKRMNIQVVGQSRSSGSSVSYFHTPIVLRVQGSLSTQDTTLVIYDQNGVLSYGGNGISGSFTGGVIPFTVSFAPVTVTFDAFSQIMATGSTANLSVLPVKIIDFTLSAQDDTNKLKLSLSNDDNDLQQVILQKSADGIHFTDAGNMVIENRNDGLLGFTFIDKEPYNNVTFYRARVIETNTERFSNILKGEVHAATSGILSPNPADKQVFMKWDNAVGGKETIITIRTMDGKLAWKKKTGGNSIYMTTTQLPSGIYFIQVSQENKVLLNRKLVIKR